MASAVACCKSGSLVVMLMLAALVISAQATCSGCQPVMCNNKLPKPIKCNGVQIPPGGNLNVDLNIWLLLEILGSDGKWVQSPCYVPKDVKELEVVVIVKGLVTVKVVAILGGLLSSLLGTLIGSVLCIVNALL